jgi:hypothetical protein
MRLLPPWQGYDRMATAGEYGSPAVGLVSYCDGRPAYSAGR